MRSVKFYIFAHLLTVFLKVLESELEYIIPATVNDIMLYTPYHDIEMTSKSLQTNISETPTISPVQVIYMYMYIHSCMSGRFLDVSMLYHRLVQ